MKELKKGYTTGTCAAISAKAAAKMIFSGNIIHTESIITPNKTNIEVNIEKAHIDGKSAECAVKKYSGDDPDITNGIYIYAQVTLNDSGKINIDGGKGIGRVVKKGLWQEIGQAAINKVPLEMIENAVRQVFDENCFEGGADIIIKAPEGERLAEKTFNPRLGIVGGISILGTSGIVEPMSEQALIDTIKAELRFKRANGADNIMLAPGNYGMDFMRGQGINLDRAVKCSNFIGEALDAAVKAGFKSVLLIGHIGKLVKLAGGIMNTHSKNADSRMEIICANTVKESDDITLLRKILCCTTTDDAVRLLTESSIREKVMENIIRRADFYVKNRHKGEIETGIIMFSNEYGILGKTENAEKMMELFREEIQ